MAKPATTGEAIAAARRMVAEARLNDPGEHFPYKRAVVDSMVTKDVPLGPDGPKDASVTAQDFTSARIADASDRYIEAQANMLANPDDPRAKELYEMAAGELVAARQAHRRYRTDANGNPVLNLTAQSATAPDQDHLRGTRFRRPGEE